MNRVIIIGPGGAGKSYFSKQLAGITDLPLYHLDNIFWKEDRTHISIFCVLIEQKAGYYECKECHQTFVPTYLQVLFAPHINRTRYMKCPHCGKRAYQKKVISK